jgi:hypothetical protein
MMAGQWLAGRTLAYALFGVALFAVSLPARECRAASKDECLEAHGRGQDLRDAGHLTSARQTFLACAQSSCPAIIQADCARFSEDLDRLVPTVGFAARDPGGVDLPDTTVYVDDQLVTMRLDDGKSYDLDPGKHVVRFAHGGRETTVTVVLNQGEKGRGSRGGCRGGGRGDGRDRHQGCAQQLLDRLEAMRRSAGRSVLRPGPSRRRAGQSRDRHRRRRSGGAPRRRSLVHPGAQSPPDRGAQRARRPVGRRPVRRLERFRALLVSSRQDPGGKEIARTPRTPGVETLPRSPPRLRSSNLLASLASWRSFSPSSQKPRSCVVRLGEA